MRRNSALAERDCQICGQRLESAQFFNCIACSGWARRVFEKLGIHKLLGAVRPIAEEV